MNDNLPYPASADGSNTISSELDAVNRVVIAIQSLSDEARLKVLRTAAMFLAVPLGAGNAGRTGFASDVGSAPTSQPSAGGFSEDRSMSPKDFVLQKRPTTDVERVAVLGYYLTHYREQPAFKTLDLSRLNTEAAQIKLSNPAAAVDNATRAGLLINASRGEKRLSAGGELYVQALPDRDEARAAISQFKSRRKGKKNRPSGVGDEPDSSRDEGEDAE